MSNEEEFDQFVQKLQKEIIDKARTRYSHKVIDTWLHPSNFGRMSNSNAHGVVKGFCGDTMEFYLHIAEGKIGNVSFVTDGCGPTIACGSILTTMIKGKNVVEVDKIDTKCLIEALEGLPDESLHCATLAITTLKTALQNWRETRSNPLLAYKSAKMKVDDSDENNGNM